jgi:microcystin-dependent protein
MSLTKFTGNTNVVSQLADVPVQTGDELKAKFDEASTAIKNYLNNTLTTETDQLVATEKTALQGLITALGRQIRTEISTSLQARYHIGKIIIETENINPATYLGFGTWELWGQGKVPVGVDTEDEDFNTVEKTGGEKEHTLTINEMPSHNHQSSNYFEGSGGTSGVWAVRSLANLTGHKDSSSQTGGGQPHNILQPYITCYMWRRTA